MRGVLTTCCRCGVTLECLGHPSFYYDVCRDSDGCARRVKHNHDCLKRENAKLKAELDILKGIGDVSNHQG